MSSILPWRGAPLLRRAGLAVLFAFGAVAPGACAAELPDAVLNRVKNATALVDVKIGGARKNGTGFLVTRDAARKVGYLATNAHVVDVSRMGSAEQRSVTVVFSPGTDRETTMAGNVIAEDAANDLALIRISGEELPQPIAFDRDVALKETLAVYAVGFPLADMLAVGERRPAVTLVAGSVSSVRQDDFGVLSVIQLDCDIHPGNSGGPVIDASGSLVGVAVAKVAGTRIGFAIPPHNLRALFSGVVSPLELRVKNARPGRVDYYFTASKVDPFGRIRSVHAVRARKDQIKGKATADSKGRWLPVATGDAVRLKEADARTCFVGEMSFEGPSGEAVAYLVQSRAEYDSGAASYGQPQELMVRFPAVVEGAQTPNDQTVWVPLVPGRDAPAAVRTGKGCVKEVRQINGATFKALDGEAKFVLADMICAQDGRSVFCLDQRGVLRQITVPECIETARLDLGGNCSCMTVSALGLVVAMPTKREVWIVDEQTLAVRHRIRDCGFERLTSARNLTVAFAMTTRSDKSKLHALDLRTGAVVRQYDSYKVNAEGQSRVRRHSDSVTLSGFQDAAVSPDGKYLFCYGFECLCRLSVTGPDLRYEEIGPRLQLCARIDFDKDSQYVAAPGGARIGSIRDHPQINGSYVYRVGDLQTPVFALPAAKYVQAIGFDGAAKLLYSGTSNLLDVHSPTTGSVSSHEYGTYSERTRQIVVPHGGRQMLLLSDTQLLWVELAPGK